MNKNNINFKKIPDTPGVYLFHGADRKILYIGKATSLRNRVRSYFSKDLEKTRGPKIVRMLHDAQSITFEQTNSVLEALLLEATLIKKHQPEANTRDKDNKSFNYLVVTKEPFPRILIVRGRDLFTKWNEKEIKSLFGPFPNGGSLKEALKVIRKIFPFRDSCEPQTGTRCFNAQIGLCPGVCANEMSKTEYAVVVRNIELFLSAKTKTLVRNLEKSMKTLAQQEKFEKAQEIKRQLFALTHIRDTALLGDEYRVSAGDDLGRIEAYDVAHISETARVGVMVVVEGGVASKKDYRTFTIRTEKKGDIAGLEELLRRRFEHIEWQLPKLIVIDGGIAQKNVTQKVLAEYGFKIPIINVVKNEKHKISRIAGNRALIAQAENDIILANAEAHRFAVATHRKKRRKNLV